MSGRGRGRGRGRGPPSASSEMLQRSAKEAGQSISQLLAARNRGIYQDIFLNSSGKKWDPDQDEQLTDENTKKKEMVTPKRSPATIYMIAKNREIHYRITNSPFNIKLESNIPDVLRYNQRDKLDNKKKNTLHSCFQGKYTKTSQGLLFPEEMVNIINPKSKRKYSKKSSNLSDDPMLLGMVTEEDLMRGVVKTEDDEGEKTNNAADGEEEFLEPDGEEEDGDDYVMDYYASDNEDDSLGDNEATY